MALRLQGYHKHVIWCIIRRVAHPFAAWLEASQAVPIHKALPPLPWLRPPNPPPSPSLPLYTSPCWLHGLQGACRGEPAVGCVLCARHGSPPRCSDVHGECSTAEQFQPAASQPTRPRGPPHHQDPHLPLQVLTSSMICQCRRHGPAMSHALRCCLNLYAVLLRLREAADNIHKAKHSFAF